MIYTARECVAKAYSPEVVYYANPEDLRKYSKGHENSNRYLSCAYDTVLSDVKTDKYTIPVVRKGVFEFVEPPNIKKMNIKEDNNPSGWFFSNFFESDVIDDFFDKPGKSCYVDKKELGYNKTFNEISVSGDAVAHTGHAPDRILLTRKAGDGFTTDAVIDMTTLPTLQLNGYCWYTVHAKAPIKFTAEVLNNEEVVIYKDGQVKLVIDISNL